MKGRKALISGGASGIGRAIAAKLVQEEVATAVADLNLTGELPPSIQAFQCDVAAAADVDALFANVQASMGTPDILICSAGRGIHEKLTEGDPEKWKAVIETNLLGALRMIRAFVPGMLQAGSGDVVLISSVSAGHAYTYGGVYAATKAALEVVAETLRLEVLPTLRVTVVAPGVTDTSFFENTISGFRTAADIGYGAMAPEAVADAVLYALKQPESVSVNHLTMRPTAQPF
ncbi:SDR family NAD(P)-dependent oxidoreductase [Pontibacter sp. 172403-2]|nr:SDR family NAD(P)-dependent oxidoreductase [Pontibacter sp. 172403-2]MBF9252816.1 SDR family NAD(P)-dependent oxidoreductase [Pontibacter sp. 172403-2]